jgi:flagellar hook-associated protein FlgK
MSDFGALSVGLSGLQAHRRALDVTGHNLANVNSPGFSRQRTDLAPITNPVGAAIFARVNGAGIGVRAGTAYRIHDQFIETRALQEHGADGSLKQTQAVLSQIETAVNEPSDNGLASQINRFMAAWHDVANRPDDLAARRQIIELGKTLAADFARLDGSLAALSGNVTRELEAGVADVNTTAVAVADLNTRILAAVNADMPAGDLMDQRDALVRSLADSVGITVRPQDKGVVDVYVGTTALVRGGTADALRVDATTTPGVTAIVWDRLGVPATAGGSVGSLQAALNTTIPGYRAQLTAVQIQLSTDVNTVHATGFDLNGAAGLPFFQMGPGGISVNPVIDADASKVAAAATATGLRDGSVAGKIADLTGASSAYNAMVLHLGIESRTINRQVATQSQVTEQVDAARESTSGVNIDEEMTNMIAIQHAYDASARFISAVDSMLDTLINRTGAGR